jgi:hypothetical protein
MVECNTPAREIIEWNMLKWNMLKLDRLKQDMLKHHIHENKIIKRDISQLKILVPDTLEKEILS